MSNYGFTNLRNTANNSENKRLLTAIMCSMLFLTVWNFFFSPSEEELKKQEAAKVEKIENENNKNKERNTKANNILNNKQNRAKKEVFLKNKNVHIGFDVANNKITFLALKNYKQHEGSVKNVILLDDEHFIESGWIGTYKNSEINWKLGEKTADRISVVGEINGIKFKTLYEIDDNYSIKIKQKITNNSGKNISVSNYSRAFLKDTVDRIENSYAFRGILTMNDGKIEENKYEKIQKQNIEKNTNNCGWIGFSDQYWVTALMSNKKEETTYAARYIKDKNSYQIDISSSPKTVVNGKYIETETIALVAPKQLELLQKFGEKYEIEKIDKVIDFGIFYFLSKPLLIILKKLYSFTNNFGIAIILLTILVRIIIFPLANRSYKVMAKMKKIAPEIKSLQEQYKDDRSALQIAMYSIYRREKINPMSAIVPLFFQIPIFLALYKVLTISIEMRDASFFGWIVDLSSRDPSSIFNIFGLLNFNVPETLQIGVLPIFMGFTMWIQQKFNPTNVGVDPSQQKIMKWLPFIFTIMFASMPAGLVLYWSCSNIFTIIQQFIILKIINKE